MKLKFLLWIFVATMIVSCSGSSSKDAKEEDTKEEAVSPSKDMASSANETQKRIDELKKVPVITNDQLKSFFPEEVNGMKRSQFSVTNMTGLATGTAEYQKDDTTEYKVMIYDCAGEAGSAFYGMQFLTGWNMEQEDDNGYQKTTSFMGSKALEQFSKSSNRHTLNFVTAERFWVTLEGRNTGLDNLKSFAQALNLEKLKDLK